MRTREKNGVVKEAIVLQWAVRIALRDFKPGKKAMGWCTAQWKTVLFCAKTTVKESRKFELARLKKKKNKTEEEEEEEEEDWRRRGRKKEKHFGRLVTFWFGTFAMLFSATGCVFRHENTRRWTVGCYNGLYKKLAVLEILRNLFVLAYIACPCYPYI